MDSRELLLQRLQLSIKALVPGAVYTFPYGAAHRAIESDLGGRAYSRVNSELAAAPEQFPQVEIITAAGRADIIQPQDDNLYTREMGVEILGYVYGGDAGMDRDASCRPAMNALLADLQIAVEGFPYFTDATHTDPLYATQGPITIIPGQQYTEPAMQQPIGFVHLDYVFRYSFTRLNP